MMEELSPDECLRLLARGTVGRIAITVDALPSILPVNYVMHDGAIVLRTVPGTDLNSATDRAIVAFLVDSYRQLGDAYGWSVLARGTATRITDPNDYLAAQRLPLRSWARDGDADEFVQIVPVMLTRRRVYDPARN